MGSARFPVRRKYAIWSCSNSSPFNKQFLTCVGAKDTSKSQVAEVRSANYSFSRQRLGSSAQTYDSQSKNNKSTKTMTDLQVATQEFSYLMQSTTNMIKTIGEGLSTMARKG